MIFAPAKLLEAMDREGLTAYAAGQALRRRGYRLDQTSILRHLRGEVVPSARTLALYAELLQLPVCAFYEPDHPS